MDCPVCCQAFTAVARLLIQCPFCEYNVCSKCVKTYLLDTLDDPHCMNCRAGWNPEFIDEKLSRSFRTDQLAKHRRDVLLDREKSRLPSTVDAAEREKQKRHMQQQAREVSKRMRGLRIELNEADQMRRELYHGIVMLSRGITPGQEAERRQFVRACPAQECRGFLTQQWRCQLCECKVCSQCHEIKSDDGEHVCSPDNLATAQLLKKDSKPCPNCAAMIFKIDGCDQMWCLSCKTAFSWRTMRIETGYVHNPEYFRWMRENGRTIERNPGDVPAARGGCQEDRLPNLQNLSRNLRSKGLWRDKIGDVLRVITHVRYAVAVNINWALRRDARNQDPNQDLRIRYLMNEIDETDWKRALLNRERKRERLATISQVYDVLIQVGADILMRANNAETESQIESAMEEVEQLRRYYNESCARVNRRFNTVFEVSNIREDWTF